MIVAVTDLVSNTTAENDNENIDPLLIGSSNTEDSDDTLVLEREFYYTII